MKSFLKKFVSLYSLFVKWTTLEPVECGVAVMWWIIKASLISSSQFVLSKHREISHFSPDRLQTVYHISNFSLWSWTITRYINNEMRMDHQFMPAIPSSPIVPLHKVETVVRLICPVFSTSVSMVQITSWKCLSFLPVRLGWKQMAIDRGRGFGRQWVSNRWKGAYASKSPLSLPAVPCLTVGRFRAPGWGWSTVMKAKPQGRGFIQPLWGRDSHRDIFSPSRHTFSSLIRNCRIRKRAICGAIM